MRSWGRPKAVLASSKYAVHMPPIKRVTLTKAQAESHFGQRLINQLSAMGHDGDLSVEEVAALHAMLREGPPRFLRC